MPKNNLPKQSDAKIPSDMLKTFFSEETPFQISEICIKNGAEGEKIEEIAHQIGLVLLGELPPKKLRAILEKEVELDPLIATKINQEIEQAIFIPVKSSLEQFYGMKATSSAQLEIIPSPIGEKSSVPKRKDVYRESTE